MTKFRDLFFIFTAFFLSPPLSGAWAAQPAEWGLGLQDPASTSAMRLNDFHEFLMWVITAIAAFVLLLLVWVVLRYNRHMNSRPSEVSHNVFIEVVWTVVPVIILVVISLQSMPLLYYVDRAANPEMTLKVTGYQWYWGYEYPDHGNIGFLSYPVPEEDIKDSELQIRNLSTDTPVVLPVEKNIQILTTAADVLHSWSVPAFGVKMDSVPGRLNETWVRITKPGIYFGQCYELCGKNHAFMPVEIHAVSAEDFEKWAAESQELGEPAPSPLLTAMKNDRYPAYALQDKTGE